VKEDRPWGDADVNRIYEMWKRRLGGEPAILVKTLSINGSPYRIVGVMPRGFRFIDDAELWLAAGQNPIGTRGRNVRYINSIARLKAGVPLERADSAMRTIAARLENQYPDTNTGFTT